MRKVDTQGKLRLQAIAGTYVVMMGFDLDPGDCDGLLGFTVHRTSHDEDEAGYITGMKCFAATDPGFPTGSHYSTDKHPVQSFQWADYSAKPGHSYTYRVTARKGTPEALTEFATASVKIRTEKVAGRLHDVHFNRGISASQEYARRFGNRRPGAVGGEDDFTGNPAFVWLSRGLFEALQDYVKSIPAGDALRVAAYEFSFTPVLMLFTVALARGVDVQIVYDGREDDKGKPGRDNRKAVGDAGLADVSTERTQNAATISHNKFIVHLHGGVPQSVWTGGTNFSRSGIFGHSNVAHVVKDRAVAQRYLDYWILLRGDPKIAPLRTAVESLSPLPPIPVPTGVGQFFSPRPNRAALDWMAELAMTAQHGLFMTFAFGMHKVFKDVYRTSSAGLRFALMEQKTRGGLKRTDPLRIAEEAEIDQLRFMPENVFAVGSLIATNAIDGWLEEQLSGLSKNVNYIHNKFMLVDPLGSDPVVVCGSANFSLKSIETNDENMLVVRGNTRIADIYLGEYMRLWSHHAFRESLQWRDEDDRPKFLKTDDWWRDAFGSTERSSRRQYFAPA